MSVWRLAWKGWNPLPKGSNHCSYFPCGLCLLLELEIVYWPIILEDRSFPIKKKNLSREVSQLEIEWRFRWFWKVKLGDSLFFNRFIHDYNLPPLPAGNTFQGHQWMTETTTGTEPYIRYDFPYAYEKVQDKHPCSPNVPL